MESCPICNESFSLEELVEHASECRDKQIVKRTNELIGKYNWTLEELELIKQPKSFTGCSVPSKVLEFLWLGGSEAANDKKFLDSEHIVRILNVADDVKPNVELYNSKNIQIHQIPLKDSTEFKIALYLEKIIEIIEESQVKKEPILVHCSAGVSRSATAVLAFLIKNYKYNLKQALSFLRNKRPYVWPNKGFFHSLIEFEIQIHGKQSVPFELLKLHSL